MGAVSQSGQTLADFEQLLPDSRVEKIWDRLRRAYPQLPEDVQFASYIEPGGLKVHPDGTGRLVMREDRAKFVVVSPNPHKRHKGQMLVSFASCLLRHWREEEKEAGHFAGAGDPATKFFKQAALEHMRSLKNWSELI